MKVSKIYFGIINNAWVKVQNFQNPELWEL